MEESRRLLRAPAMSSRRSRRAAPRSRRRRVPAAARAVRSRHAAHPSMRRRAARRAHRTRRGGRSSSADPLAHARGGRQSSAPEVVLPARGPSHCIAGERLDISGSRQGRHPGRDAAAGGREEMATSSSTNDAVTVDADGHVLEPRDVWLRYLEPDLRDRAIRIERDAEGVENLLVDGRPHGALRGRLGALGGIGMESADLMSVGQRSYEDGCPPGGYDPSARLAVMDSEKIDVVLLYPTIGIAWEGLVRDPRLATAYCRAYNRWIVDFCATDRRRLVPIAHVCLMDPEGAVGEVERARRDGCAGVYLSPDPASRAGIQFDDPRLAPFWSKVQDLDMPVAFHVVA